MCTWVILQYEDYVRYIAKGMVIIRPSMVKYIVRGFMSDLDGVICPSEIVYDLYQVQDCRRKTGHLTGIKLEKSSVQSLNEEDVADLKEPSLVFFDENHVVELVSCLLWEISAKVLAALTFALEEDDKVRLLLLAWWPLPTRPGSLKPRNWYSG